MAANRSASGIPCPLCGAPAKLIDWQPQPWVSVERCPCGGFFVQAGLLDRLAALDPTARGSLHARVAGLRASNREAWVTTVDD